jgi:hypothetical protein
MGFAMFNVFFFLTGALVLQLLRLSGVHMDLLSFCFLLFNFSVSVLLLAAVIQQLHAACCWWTAACFCPNFSVILLLQVCCCMRTHPDLNTASNHPTLPYPTLPHPTSPLPCHAMPCPAHCPALPCPAACQVVGILSLFFLPVPLFLKQAYTVWVGICVAYIFTHVPEWTSWVLLVIMALYDLAAVLLPGGPLKVCQDLHFGEGGRLLCCCRGRGPEGGWVVGRLLCYLGHRRKVCAGRAGAGCVFPGCVCRGGWASCWRLNCSGRVDTVKP